MRTRNKSTAAVASLWWRSYKNIQKYTKICQVLPWSDMMYKAASHSMDKPSTILVIKIPHWSISRNIQQSVHHRDCFVTAPARRSCEHTAEIQHKCASNTHTEQKQSGRGKFVMIEEATEIYKKRSSPTIKMKYITWCKAAILLTSPQRSWW